METRKRIFVAVELPEVIRMKLEQILTGFSDLPVRLLDKKLWHITVSFLGYIDDREEAALAEILTECLQGRTAFRFNINSLDWGPPGTTPRMIWANIGVTEDYIDFNRCLKQKIQAEQKKGRFQQYKSRKEQFNSIQPHITLARFRAEEWAKVKKAFQKQNLVMPRIKMLFLADVIHIMQSRPRRAGTEYTKLASLRTS